MMQISPRIQNMVPSLTVEIATRARQLEDAGADLVDLSVGEPDFAAPRAAKTAAAKAIAALPLRYGNAGGLPDLIGAVKAHWKRKYGLAYRTEEIVISSGAKQSVFNALMTLCRQGDRVVIPTPCWGTYTALARLANAEPVRVFCSREDGLKITPVQIARAATPRMRVLILNNPCNPTGAVYSRKELAVLARLAIEHDFYILADEVYENLVFGKQRHVPIASLGAGVKQRTITVSGVSKSFGMTGWRIGYAGAPLHVARCMSKLQAQITHHPSMISMHGALGALRRNDSLLAKKRKEYQSRRDLVVSLLQDIPGLSWCDPQGAFYIFPDVSAFLGKRHRGMPVDTAEDLCRYLLTEEGLAVVPGSAFGVPAHIRISFAAGKGKIRRGLRRLKHGLSRLA